jgi:hypothetical protein
MAPPPDGKPPPSSGRGRIKKSEKAAGTPVKGKFLRASGEKVRATLKAARDLKAKSAPKLDPAPIPEKLEPPATKQGLAAKAAEARAMRRSRLNGKQQPAAVAPEVAPAAARAKSRSASRTKGAASSSSGAAAEPSLAVVVAPAPKRPARGRSSSATPPTVPAEPPARSRSKDKAATPPAAAAEQPADTPAPKRQAKAPDEAFKTRANLEYIAANMLEAVKIDGFDVDDAVRALTLQRAREGATDKENKAIDKEMGKIWRDNSKAIAAFNAREKAD